MLINLSVDESTDVRKRRIMNMSLTDGETLYHWCSKEMKPESMNASSIADWIIEEVSLHAFY
jgi:hypothetical protein